MSRPTWLATTAGVVVATMFAAACTGGSRKAVPKHENVTTSTVAATPTARLTIHPGGGTVEVSIRPSIDGKLRVTFAPTERPRSGAQWRAAAWNAVAAATLITGAPLADREIGFAATGAIDGRQAGALLTVAVAALIRGDVPAGDLTMTGSINPDGSIGRGGRIRQHRVQIAETTDIYDAYRRFTGKTLRQLPDSTNTRLSVRAYERSRALVRSWVAKYEASLIDFQDLAPAVRQDLAPYATVAANDERQAEDLTNGGLYAGAFAKAVNAAAFMNAISRVGQSFPVLLTRGVQPFVARIRASHSMTGEVTALLAGLRRFTPKTVSDAGALMAAGGSAIDVVSLARLASDRFGAATGTEQDSVTAAVEGAIYFELADSLVTAAHDVLSIGRGLGGARLGPKVDTTDVARFFRQAAEANLAALGSGVPTSRTRTPIIGRAADQAFAAADSQYALARAGDAVLESLPPYFGSGEARDFAELGGAISLYARTAELVVKYSELGRVNPDTLELTGIADVVAFDAARNFAKTQLASNIGLLRAKLVNPVIVVADNEIASVDEHGDGREKFDALGDYWDGYLNSRVLDNLGGFAG